MKRFVPAALIGVFAVAGTLAAVAADVPRKAGEEPQAGASTAPGDLKAELAPAQYNRVVKPIEAKLAAVEKIMKGYDKEMEKTAEKRNERLLLSYKARAGEAYLGAALAAKKALNLVKKESHKAAITQQYEEPNRKKAIDIFLELATAAHDKHDVRMAVAYYKRILTIDKENAQAREGLTKIAKELQESKKSGKKKGGKGTGGDLDWSKGGKGIGGIGL